MPNAVYDDEESENQKLNGGLTGLPEYEDTSSSIGQDELERVKSLDNIPSENGHTKDESKNTTSNSEPENNEPKWYTGEGVKQKTKGWFTKKRAAAAAGITASVMGISALYLAPLMGPLEFIHMAETVRLPHFGAQEDAGDIRLNALLRYAKKRAAGETRLTYLESKYFAKITADMERSGFKARFDPITSNYKGMYVDTASEKSPYRGMSNEDLKVALEQKFGSNAFQVRDGKFYMPEGKSGFLQQYKTLRLISKEMGYGGVTAAMRARVLSKYGVVTWNPFKILDKKINESLAKTYTTWKKERDAKIKNGYKTTITTAGAQDKDSDGKTTPAEGAGTVDGDAETSKVKQVFDSVKGSKSLSVAGGLAAVAGVVCTAKAINDQAGEFKYINIAEPLMREGTEALAGGNQVASGLNFNDTQLDVASRLMRGKDAYGNVTNWDQAESIRANSGGSGGVPLDPGITEALMNIKIPYLSWTEDPGIEGLCGNVGVAITTGVSITLTVVSGGFASAAVGLIAGPYFTDMVITKVSSLIAGDAANLDFLGGSYGARADMGVKLAADFAGMQSAADVMSPAETTALNQVVIDANNEEFARLPLKDRLFAVKERRSLAGRFIDAYPKSGGEAMSGVASLFSGSFSRVISGFSTLTTSPASAQSLKYDYGLPKFGFTLDELSDERFADPYDNAQKAAAVFDSADGGTYIARAMTCYGVSITKTAEGWSAVSQQNAYKEYFKAGERKPECTDRSNTNWMRTRYFIFDTATMDSYTCLQGEGQSCTNSGFGDGALPTTTSPTATSGGVGTLPTGTSKELALKIWESNNITFQTPEKREYFKRIVDTGGQSSCGGFKEISPTLLGTILALSEKYKIVLGVFIDGHQCNSGDHPRGLAVDINGVKPISGPGGTDNTLSYRDFTLPVVKDFYLDLAKTLSANGGGKINQYQCFAQYGATPPNVSTISGVYTGYLDDPCTHLHTAVKS